jgi:hypothetical protein
MIEKLSDDQLLNQLEKAELADRVQNSDEWGIVHDAMKRVVALSKDQLSKIDPANTVDIIRLQERIALFDEGFLPTLIRNLRDTGEYSFQELHKRRRYGDFWMKVIGGENNANR